MPLQDDFDNNYMKCEACNISLELPKPESFMDSIQVPAKSSFGKLAFVKKGYRITSCPGCGLMQTEVSPDFDANEIYTQDYFQGETPDGYYDYLGSEHLLTHEYLNRVKLIRSYQPEGKLLEIGCASGGFLIEAKQYFSVQGIDVSAFAIETARKRGLDVDCNSIEESSIINPSYDVVVLFDTIEHLPRPKRTLKQIHSILSEGGYVFITTGDIGSRFARICGKQWRLLTPPQHLWFFNKNSISLLLQGLGFEITSIRYLWRKVPLSLMWYQLFRGKATPLPDIFGKLVIPVNLYDTMTVVARKQSAVLRSS